MNVDLPDRDGPVTATNARASMERLTPRNARTPTSPVGFRKVLDSDDRHRRFLSATAPEG